MLGTILQERSGGSCELCAANAATIEYTISPKEDHPDHQVALCETCFEEMQSMQNPDYWRILEGSIWNQHVPVQTLTYRLLAQLTNQDWAREIRDSVELDENTVQWAMDAFKVEDKHRDAYGNELQTGDTVVLTQNLNVKGTSFSAAKGTVVKKIRLVPDNTEQIEGKINEQVIVILTKYVKKS